MSRRTDNPTYGGFLEACVHSALGLASTTVHGRRALHLEGDWCAFDSSPRVQRHPQVACCEFRCHGVIPRTRRSTRRTVSLCEAVFSCPRPEGRACRRHRQGRHYTDPNVLAVSINMSETMTGINMEPGVLCCFGGKRATKVPQCWIVQTFAKAASGFSTESRHRRLVGPVGNHEQRHHTRQMPSCAALFGQDLFGTSH